MTEQFNTPDSILARLERLQASGKTALRPSPLSSEMILARLSGKGINVSDITASDVRREILRRKIEVIRAAAKDVSKEHRDANGKWASNPAGEPKGKIKHAVLIIDGKRYKGASHMSALMDWGTKNHKEGLPKVPERHQGFETESGHYLDREEAAEYGLKHNLVKEDADEAENTGKLRSEMLHLKATDGKLYAVETITAEARTAEQDLAPELREHNRIRDEAEAPYRHAMARLIAAAELAKLKEKKAASKKKKEQEEAALIALWLLLMQDASQEAYATAGNALGGLLAVKPPAIPLTDAGTPQIEPQNEIPPVTTEEASSYFDRRKPLIQDIPNRVMERLDKAIDAGRSLGEDDRLLRLRLKREAQAIQSGYGEMVARNEAQATYTGAQIATLRKAGFATKIWVTMDDDRVRESHIDCGQQGEVPLDKPFMNGLMYPCEPDAPPEETCNCRCWLVGGRRIGEAVQATAHDVSGESRDEGGKWTSGDDKYPVKMVEAHNEEEFQQMLIAAKVSEFEHEKRNIHDHEEVRIVLSNGNHVDIIGKEESVPMTSKNISEMKQDGNSVLTHNHPYVASLSSGDFDVASKANLKEIRAVDSKYTYIAKRPEGGWPNAKEIKTSWNRFFGARAKAYQEKIESKEITLAQANEDYTHYVTDRVCKKYGIHYERQ
tara:strand:+ start:11171 stop:13168 length:1998 start_codon:yes stop_codon:yes gene_type:complete